MNTDFTVQTEVFEGPFAALLDLIEKHKLSINEVSLSSITDEYIEHVKKINHISMNDMSGFIVVAATLVLIKSLTLLPNLAVTHEEKGEIEVLEKRLETFQVVKAISGYVRNQYGKTILYCRPFVRTRKKSFKPGSLLTADILINQVLYAIEHIPRDLVLPVTTVKKSIAIEDILASLLIRVQREARFVFSDFAKIGTSSMTSVREIKTFMVVTFLAVLEMVKNGTLEASQEDDFGDITLAK